MPTDFSFNEDEWLSVDFTLPNNTFYVDKFMPLDDVNVLSPAGMGVPLANAVQGKRRSSFDMQVEEQGTYRVTSSGKTMYFVSYQLPNGSEPQRARGSIEKLSKVLPKAQ